MFVLIENEKHLSHHLMDTVISIGRSSGLFQVRRGVSVQKHIRTQYMPTFPTLVCTYTAMLQDGPILAYVSCARLFAKMLVYKSTNKVAWSAWQVCGDQNEYHTWQKKLSVINNISKDNIIPSEDTYYGPNNKPSAKLATYATYPNSDGLPILRLFTVTLKEAKSLVYFDKDKEILKTAKKVGELINLRTTEQKIALKDMTKNFRREMVKEGAAWGKLIRRNEVLGGDDIQF